MDHTGPVHLFDEIGNIVIRRSEHDILAGALLDNLTIAQNCDLIAKPQRFIQVMSDEDDGLFDFLLDV